MGKRIIAIAISAILSLSLLSGIAFAESSNELNLDKKTKAIIDAEAIMEINSQIGYISPADKQEGLNKSALANKIMTIREKAIKSPNSVTKYDIKMVQSYIDQYSQNSTIDNYIPKSIQENPDGLVLKANPGDYQSKNLWLPGQVQSTNYYCGPASAVAVLRGRNINVTQSTMATRLGTTTNGTVLARFPGGLNYYNGTNGNNFRYALMQGPGSYTTTWAVNMTNASISTILGNYGVVYDVHMVNSPGSARLQGYETMSKANIYHYVAGEGFNSSSPSNRICYYYDSNNQKTNLGNRHMNVTYQTMARLTDDFGLIF
ncbi:MAG: C39 family peptidase [Syntrophomonadaceae bacterium]|jgi:hypothetical protein